MMAYNKSQYGEVEYNWTYVNELLDSLLQKYLKPFFELWLQSKDYNRSKDTLFYSKGQSSPLLGLKGWKDLILAFMNNCISYYGLAQVETCYFEIWNVSDLDSFAWSEIEKEQNNTMQRNRYDNQIIF